MEKIKTIQKSTCIHFGKAFNPKTPQVKITDFLYVTFKIKNSTIFMNVKVRGKIVEKIIAVRDQASIVFYTTIRKVMVSIWWKPDFFLTNKILSINLENKLQNYYNMEQIHVAVWWDLTKIYQVLFWSCKIHKIRVNFLLSKTLGRLQK